MKELLIVFMLVLPCFCQQDSEKTMGYRNGRFWQTLDSSQKIMYLIGFNDARSAAEDHLTGMTYGDVEKGVDRFYQERENLMLPISYVVHIFAMKVNGATQSEVEKDVKLYRQVVNAIGAQARKEGK